jgi:hypothetical protein
MAYSDRYVGHESVTVFQMNCMGEQELFGKNLSPTFLRLLCEYIKKKKMFSTCVFQYILLNDQPGEIAISSVAELIFVTLF